jgi:membrane protein implicated in regulation of membrane protease activity
LKKSAGFDDIVGRHGFVVRHAADMDIAPGGAPGRQSGQVEIGGETWNFESDEPLAIGQKIKVKSHRGLTLHVIGAKEEN